LGRGERQKKELRAYVLEHLYAIQYRTEPCQTFADALRCEAEHKAEHGPYMF
jgi:hypothetical protein